MTQPSDLPPGVSLNDPHLNPPANDQEALYQFRKRYRGYMPWNLAKVRGDEMLWEFTSFPWKEADGRVLINARPIGIAADNRTFEVRKQVSVNRWSSHRQKAYKEGFKVGAAWAIRERSKLLNRPFGV